MRASRVRRAEELDWAVLSAKEAEEDVQELVFRSMARILDHTKITDPRAKWRLDVGAEMGLCKVPEEGGELGILPLTLGFDADVLEEVLGTDLDKVVGENGWAHQTSRCGLGGGCMVYAVGTPLNAAALVKKGVNAVAASIYGRLGDTTSVSKMYNGTISHSKGPWASLMKGRFSSVRKFPFELAKKRIDDLRGVVARLSGAFKHRASVDGCKKLGVTLGSALVKYLDSFPRCASLPPPSTTRPGI